ncbi:MAG: hypothetical protein KDA78_15655 [Planctomycetaceae bacterium]|nr:hypothetical protein [Planctomycetaceae bacterium]
MTSYPVPPSRLSWSSATILSAASAILIPFVVVWCVSIISGIWNQPVNRQYESIVVAISGDVLIRRQRIENNYWVNEYFTLDRKPFEYNEQRGALTSGTTFFDMTEQRWSLDYSSAYLQSFVSHVNRNENWYFVMPDGHAHEAYFEIYDSRNNRRVYYLGRKGKTPTKPSPADCFQVEVVTPFFQHTAMVAGGEYYYESLATIPSPTSNQAIITGGLLDHAMLLRTLDQGVVEIDLFSGEVRELQPAQELLHIQGFYLSKIQIPASMKVITPEVKPDDPLNALPLHPEATFGPYDRLAYSGYVLSYPDRLVWQSLMSTDSFEIVIPESLRLPNVTFTLLGNDQVLYQRSEPDYEQGLSLTSLYWADHQGKVVDTRKDIVQTALFRRNPNTQAPLLAMTEPAPLAYGILFPLVMLEEIQRGYGLSLAAAWQMITPAYVVWLLVLIAVASALCWQYRKLKQLRHQRIAAWEVVLLLLMGPFAFLIFWLHLPKIIRYEETPEVLASISIMDRKQFVFSAVSQAGMSAQ